MTVSDLDALVGESAVMREMRATIQVAARSAMSILIQGPTGSGKELVAAALHAESGRQGKFVAFNVCAISDTMFEDALFGHIRGAFTGASERSLGFLREADGGTAFFDEISGLPPSLQPKLLRAIETKEFRPVGGSENVRSDARIIAATNEDLEPLVAAHKFRADLAYRLCGVTIRVPSLAERIEDVPQLTRHFLVRCGFARLEVTNGALEMLKRLAWSGNVRELKNLVEWTALVTAGTFDEDAIFRALSTRRLDESAEGLAAEAVELREALVRHDWNKVRAAHELGIHVATVYRRMKLHRISAPRIRHFPPMDHGRRSTPL
ncbi:MAG: sigma 54-interacting transcriptional regulator [Gemmatimonadaceae bacterium]